MSGDDETIRMPAASVWGAAPASAPFIPPAAPAAVVRHAYPLAVRDPSLGTAAGLVLRSLPYALARAPLGGAGDGDGFARVGISAGAAAAAAVGAAAGCFTGWAACSTRT